MPCFGHRFADGSSAIICTPRQRRKKCVGCGQPANLLCDWKVKVSPKHPAGTCDKPICSKCTFSPAPDKDLCPEHRAAFDQWKASR